MANPFTAYPKRSLQADEFTLTATFALDGANDGALVEGDDGMTLAHTATGKYTVAWKNKWLACRGVLATFHSHTNVDLKAQPDFASIDNVAKTALVYLLAVAAATDPQPKATYATHLTVQLVMRNNMVKGA